MKIDTTRRTFLGAAAGVAGLSAIGVRPAAAVIEPEPWGLKLGIATYSFRDFDRAKTIEMIKALKVQYISIKDVHLKQTRLPDEVEAGAKEFTDAGLKIMSGGNIDLEETTEEGMRKHFEYAKHAGMPMMVCAPTHENLKTLEALVKEYNIKCAIHNHGPEDKNFPTPQSVLEAVKGMDPRVRPLHGYRPLRAHRRRRGEEHRRRGQPPARHAREGSRGPLRKRRASAMSATARCRSRPFSSSSRRWVTRAASTSNTKSMRKDPLPGMQRSFSYMRGVLAGLAA